MINRKEKAAFRSIIRANAIIFAITTVLAIATGTTKAESARTFPIAPTTTEIRANLQPIINPKDTLWYPVDSLVSNSIVISTATLSSKGAKSVTSKHKVISFDPKKKKSWKNLWPIKSFK